MLCGWVRVDCERCAFVDAVCCTTMEIMRDVPTQTLFLCFAITHTARRPEHRAGDMFGRRAQAMRWKRMHSDAGQNMCAQLCTCAKYAGGFGFRRDEFCSRDFESEIKPISRLWRTLDIYAAKTSKLQRFECRRVVRVCAFTWLTVVGLIRRLCLLGGVRSPHVVRVRVAIGVLLLWTTSTTDAADAGEVGDGFF